MSTQSVSYGQSRRRGLRQAALFALENDGEQEIPICKSDSVDILTLRQLRRISFPCDQRVRVRYCNRTGPQTCTMKE